MAKANNSGYIFKRYLAFSQSRLSLLTMNLEKEILAVRSKDQVVTLVRWVGKDTTRFKQLMDFFLEGESKPAQKSAWIIGHCAELHPELVNPWLKAMIKKMRQPGLHGALKRNVVRILQFVDIPRGLQGMVANLCFELIASMEEPIAVRTFSITVLANIAREEPALRKELEIVVRQMLPYSTPAFRARAKKILKDSEIEELVSDPEEMFTIGRSSRR
jgi:hypothetical protein